MKITKLVTSNMPKDQALEAYLKLVNAYKVQNPVKYAQKKAAFDVKLAELGFKPEKVSKE